MDLSRVGARPLASLGMYDLPALRPATDALWAGIAARLRRGGVARVPAYLERNQSLAAVWRDPGLLLAQTCGAPFVQTLAGAVRLVAIPAYDAPGCEPVGGRSAYRSAIVAGVRGAVDALADLRGATVAVNEWGSHSGCVAFRASLAPLATAADDSVVGRVLLTGSHRASLCAVAAGEAHAAAIDAVTLALLQDIAAPEALAVRRIAWTDWAPPLPFITAGHRSDAAVAGLYAALAAAIDDPAVAPHRRRLRLAGIGPPQPDAYDRTRALIAEAATLGDWTPHAGPAMQAPTEGPAR